MNSIDFFHPIFSSQCSRTPLAPRSPILSSRDTRRKNAFSHIVTSAGENDLGMVERWGPSYPAY
jgi:hypothetical protein